jgi:hypothetical protein
MPHEMLIKEIRRRGYKVVKKDKNMIRTNIIIIIIKITTVKQSDVHKN